MGIQAGKVVNFGNGQAQPVGEMLPDDLRGGHTEAVVLFDDETGEVFPVDDLHQPADILRMVGHAVEHRSVLFQDQLPVERDEAVKGEDILQKGYHRRDAPGGDKQLDPLGAQGVQREHRALRDLPAARGRVVDQGAVHVEKDNFDHSQAPLPFSGLPGQGRNASSRVLSTPNSAAQSRRPSKISSREYSHRRSRASEKPLRYS